MIEVLPAILPKDYEDLKNKIALVKGLVKVVQIDICDGIFVPSLTWPFESAEKDGVASVNLDKHFLNILNEQEGMPFWEEVEFELDLMVHDAVENFDIYTKLGPKRILFHLEAMENFEEFKDFLEGIDVYVRDSIEMGVAFRPSFDLEKVFSLTSSIDFVQFMGNDKIGYQGVSLDEAVYEKIKILRNKYPDLPISVDIGVNQNTAPRLIQAGATKLAAGSAIFKSDDIMSAIEELKNLS